MDKIFQEYFNGSPIKGKDHNNRKNRKGRGYSMQTISLGPARSTNQKTTITIRHKVV